MHGPSMPAIGTYLKPVGPIRWEWCIRVTHLWPPNPQDHGPHWRIGYERWGYRDGKPFNDGHINPGFATDIAATARPNVWRDPYTFDGITRWRCCPLFYRTITADQDGQTSLF